MTLCVALKYILIIRYPPGCNNDAIALSAECLQVKVQGGRIIIYCYKTHFSSNRVFILDVPAFHWQSPIDLIITVSLQYL